MGALRDHIVSLVYEQVKKNHIVVWFDPDGWYSSLIENLTIPGVDLAVYRGSFFALRYEVESFMQGEEPPRLIVYVPMAEEDTCDALAELAVAGAVMKPGQSPWQRNTRPSLVAKRTVGDIGGKELAESVEKQVEAGKLSFADVDSMTDRVAGGRGDAVVAAVFQTTNPVDVALALFGSERFDAEVTKRNCLQDIAKFLGEAYGVNLSVSASLHELRALLAQHVLITEFGASVDDLPPELRSITVASDIHASERQQKLAQQWRMRRDLRDSYSEHADRVERQLGIESISFKMGQLQSCFAFAGCERVLQSALAQQLAETAGWTDSLYSNIRKMVETRLEGFWSDWPEKYPDVKPGWQIIWAASELLYRASCIEQLLNKQYLDPDEMVSNYVGAEGGHPWCLLDTAHRDMRQWWFAYDTGAQRDSANIEQLVIFAGRRYMEVGSQFAAAFVSSLEKAKFTFQVYPRQTEVYDRHVAPALMEGKTAYLLVDSLRYEMALELSRELRDEYDLSLLPAVATVPTVTEIGMAALMPGAEHGVKIRPVGARKLALEVGGVELRDRKDRITYLKERMTGVYEGKFESLLAPTKAARIAMENAKLIFLTSDEIDDSCESANEWTARRTTQSLLQELPRVLRTLRTIGCATIIVTADHGHLFLEQLTSGMKIDAPGGETCNLRRRAWVGRGGVSSPDVCMRASLSSMGLDDGDLEIVVPRGFGAFKVAGGGDAYFHGGMSLPEILIPVLVLRPKEGLGQNRPKEAAWNLTLGSAKITSRFVTVNIQATMTALIGGEPPRVQVEVREGETVISKTVGATYGLAESSGEIALQLKAGDQWKIEQNTITLMLVKEPSEKYVSLCIADAATGRVLDRIDQVEVDIAF